MVISTNCRSWCLRRTEDVLFWALSWRIKGITKAAVLWYCVLTTKNSVPLSATQSSCDCHFSATPVNQPETSSTFNSDCNQWQLFEHSTVASTLNLTKEKRNKVPNTENEMLRFNNSFLTTCQLHTCKPILLFLQAIEDVQFLQSLQRME